eukprot:CAMPEP_0202725994 /NCGR_PEP_ID=MMETSP1385-20130828/184383_1 /ASSEMBLY_ACC=CAM_ASM_000861 /TAXON_ID=933848 /ORGANISM="Elphidium margaritaceum" /LENGTH=348 /DNA_ID=CAMNT_0049392203 /DNA_START=18 /DNA_END=1064 /DNA_ORIENTATION=+
MSTRNYVNTTTTQQSSTPRSETKPILAVFKKCGYCHAKPLSASLQGSVWSVEGPKGNPLVVKVTNKKLDQESMANINGVRYSVREDIKKEAKILRHLTAAENGKISTRSGSQGIVQFVDFFQSKTDFYLVMENGGSSLFDFVIQAHQLIACDKLDVSEWHKCVKVIYKQLLDALQYMHSEGIVHYDISLENMVISDVGVIEDDVTKKISFVTESIAVKLIDFGLADVCSVDKAGLIDCMSTKFVGKEVYKSPEVQRKRQAFNAMANDVFCSGVCLYMMVMGSSPWRKAISSDQTFAAMMQHGILPIIEAYNKLHLITVDILHLLSRIFRYEHQRITLGELLKHKWVQV